MKRAVGVQELYSHKFNTMPFTAEWKSFIGEPEMKGSWFIWGQSGNGKTVFAAKLAKYLTQFGRVAYNSLEEGLSQSIRRAFQLVKMHEVSEIILLDRESVSDLYLRLQKRKSPDIIIIDSFQYSGLNKDSYKKLLNDFNDKLFIIVSHAEGKQPSGRTAKTIRFDANIKIWVEGFKAYPQSRYGGGEPYIIWAEGTDNF